jgi:hypothetical protein
MNAPSVLATDAEQQREKFQMIYFRQTNIDIVQFLANATRQLYGGNKLESVATVKVSCFTVFIALWCAWGEKGIPYPDNVVLSWLALMRQGMSRKTN